MGTFTVLTYQVNYHNGIIAEWRLSLVRFKVRFVEKKSRHVWREDGRVHNEQEDDPVPHRLEGRVVKNGPLVDHWALQLILRQHIGSQRQHLTIREREKCINSR